MEEQKFDAKSIIGYVLLVGIAMWFFMVNKPTEAELEAQKKEEQAQEQAALAAQAEKAIEEAKPAVAAVDSLAQLVAYKELGAFGYSKTLASANGGDTVIENELLKLTVANKGGYVKEAVLKEFTSKDGKLVSLIKDGKNASFGIDFSTKDSRVLNTNDLFFQPTVSKVGDNTQLSMKLKVSEAQFLEYVYVLKPNEYMLDFFVRSQGLEGVIDGSKSIDLNWELAAFRNAKSGTYENRYTDLIFEYEDGRDDYVSQRDFKETDAEDVTYVAYRQHFFSSILLNGKGFKKADFTSTNLLKDEEVDTLMLRKFTTKVPLELTAGNLNYEMNWYYGPTDYQILSKYERNLDEVVPLGWGIFGWINRYVFIPVFAFLSSVLPYGIAIIVLTVLVRLALSPITYKSYVSQAKMKVLKPEITEINEKYKDNAMKKQQETMALYRKAGVSPLSGCVPALLQIPVFYALFNFFPSAIQLRQKSFLWADDLSSYDVIAELPFRIPFYGDHISLFPILASIAIFFYMTLTTGQNMPAQQPGMPNMKFIMYLSPLFMLVFFNNYASGLSLYYFVSNLITIGIMLVIKNFIINDEKIHAKIEENKKKPKKQSKFQQKLKEAMEQAEKQQKMNKK